jgi:hypothetical protein
MTFGQPWMLLGALAALIPLLVHLFDRRRPRPTPFGAISFVLRSQRRTASRLKLKRLLLYALRTLILLAIPFALARPELRADAQAATLVSGPSATAIVLDASLSMRYARGESHFERARELARDALRELRPEEPATLVLCTANAAPAEAPGFDRGKVRSAIDEARPTWQPSDLNRCLELAARALQESPLPGKRLVLVSDLTARALRLETPAPTVQGPSGEPIRPEVVLRDAAGGARVLPNRAIVDLKIEPALQAGPRTFQFTFTIRNFSPTAAADLEAVLRLGDRAVAKGFVSLPANGTAQKTLTHRFEEGGSFTGEVTLTPDELSEDDRRPFVLQVPKEIRALVVNGEPSATRFRDEAFFVDAALGAQGSPVTQTLKDPTAAWQEDFAGYDLIYLLNVAAPSAEVASRLAGFVQAGGGLFVSMGNQVEPEEWNARLGPLLPRPLRLVKTAVLPDADNAPERAARLGQVDLEHPVLTPFTGEAGEGLTGARFYKYMLLEAEGGGGAGGAVLATYDDGAPALVSARHGQGRVVLYTSTVDRDWADLPIRTSFLPLMQRISSYLAGSLEEREAMRVPVGSQLPLRAVGARAVGQVVSPSGQQVPVEAQKDGARVAGPIVEPGVHRVLDEKGQPLVTLDFAAVLDASESDLTRLEQDALEAWFGEATVKRAGMADADGPSVPLWTWLIVAAALAFFFEGTLLRK